MPAVAQCDTFPLSTLPSSCLASQAETYYWFKDIILQSGSILLFQYEQCHSGSMAKGQIIIFFSICLLNNTLNSELHLISHIAANFGESTAEVHLPVVLLKILWSSVALCK